MALSRVVAFRAFKQAKPSPEDPELAVELVVVTLVEVELEADVALPPHPVMLKSRSYALCQVVAVGPSGVVD